MRIQYTILPLSFLLLSACGGPSFDSAEQAVTTFLDRSIRGDESGARECLVADEQSQHHLTFNVDRGATYELGMSFPEEGHTVVPVRFTGQDETMDFVVVDGSDGHRVSLGFTIARGMTRRVQAEMNSLGEGATPEQMAEAMRRGMNAQPGGR